MQVRHSRVKFDLGATESTVIGLAGDRLVAVVVPPGPGWGALTIQSRHTDIVNTVTIPWSDVVANPVSGEAGWHPIGRDLALMDTRLVRTSAGPEVEIGLILSPRP